MIIYEKKLPTIKLSLEAAGGIFMRSFRRYDPQNLWIANGERTYSKTSNMSGEIIAHICMPRISENVYLRTGVCYYELNGKDNSYLWKFKSSSLYIPIQLEYVYSIGFIQPKIAVGFDYFTSRYNSDQPKSNITPYDIDPNILDLLDGASYNGAEFLITAGTNIKIAKNLSWSLNYNFGGTQSLTTGLLVRL